MKFYVIPHLSEEKIDRQRRIQRLQGIIQSIADRMTSARLATKQGRKDLVTHNLAKVQKGLGAVLKSTQKFKGRPIRIRPMWTILHRKEAGDKFS